VKILFPIALIFLSVSCGSGGVIKAKSSLASKKTGAEGNPAGDWNSLYLTGYEKEVLPLLAKNCGSCHAAVIAPHFASPDPKESATAALEAKKIDFSAVEQSRLVVRLTKDHHNCGEKAECLALGEELKTKIASLVSALPKTDAEPALPQTPGLDFTNLVDSDRVIASPSFMIIEAESLIPNGTTAPLPSMAVGATTYVTMPGAATVFTFPVTTILSGRYFMWARYRRAGAGTMNANFTYQTPNPQVVGTEIAQAQNRNFPVRNTQTLFVMSPLNQVQQGTPVPFIITRPQTFNITLNVNTLDLDMLILTDVDYTKRVEKEPTVTKKVLNFDLTSLGVPGGKIEIAASVIDPEGSKSYNFERPRYFGPQTAKLKGMKILVNGRWNPVYSQFTAIDVEAANGDFLSTNGMTVSSDKGVAEDKFSLAFEEIAPK
jgi:hypothetical protein